MAHTNTTFRNLTFSVRAVLFTAMLGCVNVAFAAPLTLPDPEEQVLQVKFDQPIKQSDIDRVTGVLFAEKSYGVTDVTSDVNTRELLIAFTAEPEMSRIIFELFKKLGYTVSYVN